ncbi:30S ribosomal protein S9 [Candidatus Margulisiibacteriota bacterium]
MATKNEENNKEITKESKPKSVKKTVKTDNAVNKDVVTKKATKDTVTVTKQKTEKPAVAQKEKAKKETIVKTKSSYITIKKSADTPQYYATGKRKTSIARVWIIPGSGRVDVNKIEGMSYLKRLQLLKTVQLPLSLLGMEEKYDIIARVKGGGISGQAGAIKAGVAKALVVADSSCQKELKSAGFLTRDARIKERKHYGFKRARKSFQYSKR